MFNVKGEYCFKKDGEVFFKGENLITTMGEYFFLNRCINEEYNPMKYIVIGNGSNTPTKDDNNLGSETRRVNAVKTADLYNKRVKLTCSFDAKDIYGITEIGVANEDILISHDVFEKIDENFLSGMTGSVDVDYTFQLTTSTIRSNWEKLTGYNNVYFIDEPNTVKGVSEYDNNNGYRKVTSINDVEETPASYYYDKTKSQLYVRVNNTVKDGGFTPNDFEMVVQII